MLKRGGKSPRHAFHEHERLCQTHKISQRLFDVLQRRKKSQGGFRT